MSDAPDPTTPEEWQEAVDLAHGCLALDSARQFGLITGGPVVDVDRADYILTQGRSRGFTPANDAVERFVQRMQAEAN